ncbi:hypothetical protein [Cellulophaga baltica]|uniref:hypothetical protein n=1 Tax=Cellulophaga baltica TaxID=76594 RepID=UPI00249489D8|nr:hypothetical protein [Cellulophaga baltica]
MNPSIIQNRTGILQKRLNSSLSKVRLSGGRRLTTSDKLAIKKTATTTLQKFLIDEVKRIKTKTYDWYFCMDNGALYDMCYTRNGLDENRYFIVDHIERLINNEFSFASTVGQERVREFKTNSSEISSLISNQKGLFNKLLTVTVSEKEDKKIWKAYDTVNEGAIIAVTIGFPVVIIGAVEALPLVYSFGQSALPTVGKELGKAFAVNKGKVALLNGFSNLGEQYLSTGIAESKWGKQNWGQIDLFDVGASAAFGILVVFR